MKQKKEIESIARQTRDQIAMLFPGEKIDMILYGSYARGEAREDSDIDLLFLVDSTREAIAEKNWQVGEIAADLFMDHEVMVSPIVENRDYYRERISLLPFFRNIDREGVRLSVG